MSALLRCGRHQATIAGRLCRHLHMVSSRNVEVMRGVNFQTSLGEVIPDIEITWETWGDWSLPGERTVGGVRNSRGSAL